MCLHNKLSYKAQTERVAQNLNTQTGFLDQDRPTNVTQSALCKLDYFAIKWLNAAFLKCISINIKIVF